MHVVRIFRLIVYNVLFQMPHESAVDPHTKDISGPDLSTILRNTSIKVRYSEFTFTFIPQTQ